MTVLFAPAKGVFKADFLNTPDFRLDGGRHRTLPNAGRALRV